MINGKDVELNDHRDPRAADPGHPERHQVTSYIPSPTVGVFHLGPLPVRMYALCILVGIVRGGVAHRPPARPPRGRAGPGPRRRGVGGAVRHRRRPALPRHHHARPLLGRRAATRSTPLKIWNGGLGIWGAIALGALGVVDRLPAGRHQLPDLRRRGRPRRRVRAGHRPVRQLVQQRALRRPDDGAVGPGDPPVGPVGGPRRRRRRGQAGAARRLPADLPLRVDLPRRARHRCCSSSTSVARSPRAS